MKALLALFFLGLFAAISECREVSSETVRRKPVRDAQFQIQGVDIVELEERSDRKRRQNYATNPAGFLPQQVLPQSQDVQLVNPQLQQPSRTFFTSNVPVQQAPFGNRPPLRQNVRPRGGRRVISNSQPFNDQQQSYSQRPPQTRTVNPSSSSIDDLPPHPKNPDDPNLPVSRFSDADAAAPYYYPPRQRLPLPKCFHNPTGYVCCNEELNELMVDTYTELESKPKFHVCNIGAVASLVQARAEKKFNTSFETIAGFEDFAQKIHFSGTLVCKVELGGKYILAYATAENVLKRLQKYKGKFFENTLPQFGGPTADQTRRRFARSYQIIV